MRIIECYIKGFGALRDLKIEFNDGLNTLLGDNGVGKSTVASFIKAMLYGLGETRKTSIEENDRKHYLPWDGGAAGGTMTFLAGDTEYRVERTFGKRPAEDTFALYDTRLGKEITDASSNLGEAFLGIDAEGFERTSFFSERNLVPEADVASSGAAAEDGVSEELSSGALNDALEILDEQRKFYQKKGGAGSIADTKREISDIEGELSRLESVRGRARESEARIIKLEEERRLALDEAKRISERKSKLRAKDAMRRADSRIKEIQGELILLNQRKDRLIEFFSGEIPTRQELDELAYKSKRAAELRVDENAAKERNEEYEKLASIFQGRLDDNEAEKARRALNIVTEPDPRAEHCNSVFSKRIPKHSELDRLIEMHTSSKKAPIILWLLLGLLFAGAGAALGALLNPFCFALCALGLVVVAIGAVFSKAATKKLGDALARQTADFFGSIGDIRDSSLCGLGALIEVKGLIDEAEALRKKYDDADRILGEFCLKFSTRVGTDAENAKIILEKYDTYCARSKLSKSSESGSAISADALLSEALGALAKFKTETDDPIREVKERLAEYESITAKIISYNSELLSLSSLRGLDGDDTDGDTAEALDEAARVVNGKISSCDGELAILGREYDRDMRELDAVNGLTIEKSKLQEKLLSEEADLRAILGAMTYLKAASEAMNEKYLAGALRSFKEYAQALGLSGERYEMKTNYSTSVVDATGTHSTESLSRGSRDGYRLASRLAILDSLYSGEQAFLLLDDPFVSFDDQRAAEALALIEKIAKDRQVIYMTCSESRIKGNAKRLR